MKSTVARGGRRPPDGVEVIVAALLVELRSQRSERNIAGQHRYGIAPKTEQLGIAAPVLRAMARAHRRDHELAAALWAQPVFESRLLAGLVEDPRAITVAQMEAWARDFDCWPIVDLCCTQVFNYTPHALGRIRVWTRRRAEFVKRAGFVLMAGMAVHQKQLPDAVFLDFLPRLRAGATDERNFVKKAVNWALRQIGKRSPKLRRVAITEARRILALGTPAARWIARDALRELSQK